MGMSEKLFPLETKHFTILPQNQKDIWGTKWDVCLKSGNHQMVGELKFAGELTNSEAKFCVKLENEYDKERYYAEIFFMMAKSLFRFTDVREVYTECRYEEEHLLKGIEKGGFVYRQTIDGIRVYSMKRQKTVWTGVYIFLGLIAGFLMGLVVSNLWLGTISGVAIGVIIGILMDKREEKGV